MSFIHFFFLADKQTRSACDLDTMRKADALACSFEQWYTKFEHLTIKSKKIKLSDAAFVSYLIGEGESTLRLPSSSVGAEGKTLRSDGDEFSSDEEDWDEEEEEDARGGLSFPELEKQIQSAIKLLGMNTHYTQYVSVQVPEFAHDVSKL